MLLEAVELPAEPYSDAPQRMQWRQPGRMGEAQRGQCGSVPAGIGAGWPTAVPPSSSHATPEEAMAAYLQGSELVYAGDCAYVDLDRDIGSYCSMLWEDRGDQLIYAAGTAFSEPDTWLLLEPQDETGGWLVVDTAEFVPGPQDKDERLTAFAHPCERVGVMKDGPRSGQGCRG